MAYKVRIAVKEQDGKSDFVTRTSDDPTGQRAVESYLSCRYYNSIKGFKKPIPFKADVEEVRKIQ